MKKIRLKVGCTWDFEQLSLIIELNNQYFHNDVFVSELYGSLRTKYIQLPSARPDYRIPDVGFSHLKKYIAKARSNNIEINYTCNGTLTGSIENIERKEKDYGKCFRMLEENGISRLTISNPLLIEIANSYCKLPIEISTILHPSFLSSLKIYSQWNVDKVCLNIYLNRNINFLRKYNKIAHKYKIRTSLVANEFCMFGSAPCLGILRDCCYNLSSAGGNSKEYFSNWPFERCHSSRIIDPSSWLKAPFILPQHLKFYRNTTGISDFKVTGRTNPIEYVNFLIKTYLSQNYQDELISLWLDPGDKGSRFRKHFDIKVSELEEVDFFSRWFSNNFPICDFSCDIGCSWCSNKYEEMLIRRSVV